MKNTDCALIIGSNAAENHPMSFKWLTKAKEERGAKIISVDPRFTRTSSKADLYAPLRSGTDIAFIGGLIRYLLENNLYHKDYIVKYTNAAFLIDEKFDFNDGLFTGYNKGSRKYDNLSWTYQLNEEGNPLKDETLQHPRTVFQLLKKHYSRYDADKVCAVTGTPKDIFLQVAETYCATGAPDKTGTILYAMGTTQHTVGTQNVRSYAMLQLLLGNTGRPGGGVNALRGESNVQGSTDMALLFHILPGYLGSPTNSEGHATLANYLKKETPASGYWSNKPKFLVSLLKAFWGDAATEDNDFAYDYLPKRDAAKNYSHIALFEAMYDGVIKGFLCIGQNPVVGGPNANKEQTALSKLDWLVVNDLFESETASFWKKEAGMNPEEIDTEVFLLPAAASFEKHGTVTNSGRWIQYRWQAVEPVGEAKPDAYFINRLTKLLKQLYRTSSKKQDAPIRELYWDYGPHDEPDIDKVMREINGYEFKTRRQLNLFSELKEDGSTCSGNWIMSGMYTEAGNRTQNRNTDDPGGMGSFLNWSYSWPANRRIIYNRCSADWQGKAWAQDKKTIWWDTLQGKWVGYDVPDFGATLAPTAPGGTNPFIMIPEKVGKLFAGLNEGPFPEHYEPYESPLSNAFSNVQLNPVVKIWEGPMNAKGEFKDFPIIATTYRLSEHYQTGTLTRNQEWLVELMPNMFVEISSSLAKKKGINNGDKTFVASARGEIEAYALITERFQPFNLGGKVVDHVGMPWHYGFAALAKGGTANRLTPHIGDGNTMIPEYKAFLCEIRRAE